MKVIVDKEGRVVDFSEDFVEWTLKDGMRVEHLEDSYTFEHDPWDYVWENGAPAYREPEPEALAPGEVLKAIFTASPALTVGIIDSVALRMKPYIPDYDSAVSYVVGSLAMRDGKVQRKTLTGWRALE